MDIQAFGYFLVKATVLLAAGFAAAAALRRAPAGARHLVWLFTLAGVLTLPAVVGLSPLRLEVLPGPAASPSTAPASAPAAFGRSHSSPVVATARTESGAAPASVDSPRVSHPAAWPRPAAGQALLVVWLAVALALLARLAAGVLAVRRIVAAARPLDGLAWKGILCDTADRLGLAELPRLVASDRVEMPFACGAWRGTVVLPSSAEGWSAERRRLVLFHELAHMRRRDLLGHLLGRLACAAYWFHPLIWTAARRLRSESERACDDLVLAGGTRPSEYAGHLLEILTSARHAGAPSAAVAMARRTEFEGRMLAILDPAARRGGPGRLRSAVLMGSLAAFFLCVAALAPSQTVPASPPAAPEPPSSAEPVEPAEPARPAHHPSSPAAPSKPARPEREAHRAERHREAEPAQEPAEDADPRPTAEQTALLARVLRTDADADVRRSAAWALAGGDGPAVEALATALKADADDGVREMAAWALAEAPGDGAAGALGAALQGDRSDEVRASAAWALGQRPKAGTAALVAAAADRAPKVREAAIWALGNQELEKAPPAVSTALRDADRSVRVVAAWALGQIADPAAASALRAAFKDEKDDEVRQALVHALMLVGDRSPELIEQLIQSKDPDLRARAIRMLSRRGVADPWPWPRPEPRPFP